MVGDNDSTEDGVIKELIQKTETVLQLHSTLEMNSNLYGKLLVWKLSGDFLMQKARNNIFIFEFRSKEDKEWVLKGAPWLVANLPMVLEIKKLLGSFIRIEKLAQKVGYGCEMRIRVLMDVGEPLPQGFFNDRSKKSIGFSESDRISFRLGHVMKICPDQDEDQYQKALEIGKVKYGPWLRSVFNSGGFKEGKSWRP
ncbi:conserved hypothetical protein [Ricinus communis]|uniref:DUF4283 domain-containing protein n=1 Tax=Ricinus communis TaxID=3988 RepID=B9SB87_RICCO|nr:conserved hypothetical protein [Ricinus communis]